MGEEIDNYIRSVRFDDSLKLERPTVDQSGVSKIESCQRPVSDIEVIALAKALRVPVTRLFENRW